MSCYINFGRDYTARTTRILCTCIIISNRELRSLISSQKILPAVQMSGKVAVLAVSDKDMNSVNSHAGAEHGTRGA